jgi:hypothetical protein
MGCPGRGTLGPCKLPSAARGSGSGRAVGATSLVGMATFVSSTVRLGDATGIVVLTAL